MVRVLEISRTPLFKHSLPQETTWLCLGTPLMSGHEECVAEPLTRRNVWRIFLGIRRGAYDLIVLPSVDIRYPYDASRVKRTLRRLVRFGASLRLTARLLEAVFRWSRNAVVFADINDSPQISYDVCALIPGFLAYFKREFHPQESAGDAEYPRVAGRMVPWSLFLPTTGFVPDAEVKKSDVFFAGLANSPARHEGLPYLRRLEAQGYRVDIPAERLTYHEYMQRMAEAWLVWSPAGFGWDCYRHYEAAFAGSVPVINLPPQPRPLPYVQEEECFFYAEQGDALAQTIVQALADKPRLRAMAARARARVLAQYTRPALVARMQAAIVERLRAEQRDSTLCREWQVPDATPGRLSPSPV